MAKVWLQALGTVVAESQGRTVTYHAGDWFECGKMDALRYIADGAARAMGEQQASLMPGTGIVARGHRRIALSWLGHEFEVVEGEPRVAFAYTIIWHTDLQVKRALLPVGVHLLRRWHVVAPLMHYDTLARDIGTKKDRECTEDVIRDLRVPVYDTRLVMVRRCPEAINLIHQWNKERAEGGDERLAFLRALYIVKPFICALPITWTHAKDPMAQSGTR